PQAEVDPVCGMLVNPSAPRGGTFEHQGTTYHFCSPGCHAKFEADPGHYLAPDYRPGVAAMADHVPASPGRGANQKRYYTCPMCPEVKEERPVPCPSCGMALEPPIGGATRTRYTCPMRPEVVRDEPGDCPICGMALE